MSLVSLSPSCPSCGHGVSFRRRWISNGISGRWDCTQCGKALRYSPKACLIFSALVGVPMAVGCLLLFRGEFLAACSLLVLAFLIPGFKSVELDPKDAEQRAAAVIHEQH